MSRLERVLGDYLITGREYDAAGVAVAPGAVKGDWKGGKGGRGNAFVTWVVN